MFMLSRLFGKKDYHAQSPHAQVRHFKAGEAQRIHFKQGFQDVVGKKIAAVATTKANTRSPRHQVFLVFSDKTYYYL